MQSAVILHTELGLELFTADGADVPGFGMGRDVLCQLAGFGPEGTLRTLVLWVTRMLERSEIVNISYSSCKTKITSLIQ